MSVLSAARTLGLESGWTLSNLTMQKTLYIAQLLHVGRTGRSMFPEPFEAWDYGPVVPAFYRAAKQFKSGVVQDVFNAPILDPDSSEAQAVRDAYATTRHMTAGQLVTYTHRQGGAWELYYREGYRGIVIPVEAIAQEWKAATRPSQGALDWANEMADEVEADPSEYLDSADEHVLRTRLCRKDLQ